MMNCKCSNWTRLWQETRKLGISQALPPSDHAPGCPEYKEEEFTRLSIGGTTCIMEPHEAKDMLEDEGGDQYTATTVMLTRDQFEKLDDFTGF